MISGAHIIIYSTNEDRAFFRDILGLATLPGGGKLGVYEPTHAPPASRPGPSTSRPRPPLPASA